MSWGELGCIWAYKCPYDCRMETCNKDCPHYKISNEITTGTDPLTIKDFIQWLSNIKETKEIWIYSHHLKKEIPFNPVIHIDNGLCNNRIIIDV